MLRYQVGSNRCYVGNEIISNLGIGLGITNGKFASVDKPSTNYYPEWNQGLHTAGIQSFSAPIRYYGFRNSDASNRIQKMNI